MSFKPESAEVVGLRVLGWLADNDDLISIFQGSTGASETDIRQGTSDPVFLGAVLDFVMMDDRWVVDCCDTLKLDYQSLMKARLALPGGEQVNWT
ncbi:MAG: DUF3572 domain-containing protein [Roseobacter sp.]|jgi:hypothetical protein